MVLKENFTYLSLLIFHHFCNYTQKLKKKVNLVYLSFNFFFFNFICPLGYIFR